MKKDQLKIAVVGGGNIGKFLSTMLMSCGYDVELVCRSKHRAIVIDNSYAFDIVGDYGEKSYLVPFVKSIDDLSSKKDIIIFATKSFDMLERVSGCMHKLTPKGMIVTIQNIYSIDKLYHLIPPESSVCMLCDFTCAEINKVTYVKDFNGISLGVYHKNAIGRLKLLSKVLSSCFKVHIMRDFVGFAMGRNIINGAISFIGGVSGLNLRDILKSSKGRKLFYKVIEESYNVCKHYRIKVQPYNKQLDYEKFLSKTPYGWFYRHRIYRVLRKQNGHIKSSALSNLEHGERTEIRCLMDTIVSYGKETNTNIDTILELEKVLGDIENKKDSIESNNINEIYNNLLRKRRIEK